MTCHMKNTADVVENPPRSAANMGLIIPRSRTQMGKLRVSHEAAAYWNQIPNNVIDKLHQMKPFQISTGKWCHDV